MIDLPRLTPLSIIPNPKGDIYHVIKSSSSSFAGFGEAYFSFVIPGSVKAWKLHKEMTLNLVVPIGSVKFVLYDNRKTDDPVLTEYTLSSLSYNLLSVPPNIWFGFKGLDINPSLVLNIANIEHREDELIRAPIDSFLYDWNV